MGGEGNGTAFAVHLRPIVGGPGQTFSAPGPLEALLAALAVEPEEESVLRWDDDELLACVDLDVDAGDERDDGGLLVLLEDLQPAPALAWTTHGGGVRLVYAALDGFEAREVAAVAAMNLAATQRHSALEIKHETRHPLCPDRLGRRCGAIVRREQRFDAASFRRHLRLHEAGDEEVTAWLEERGMAVGGRYDHSRCPVAPSDRGGRQPVLVGEKGVHCFVCEADGACAGSSRPGFFPFAHLCGTPRASSVYRCLENAVHWGHARYVFEGLGLPAHHARLVYSAGIAMFRGREDAGRCFAAGRDMVRIGDRWTNECGEPYTRDVSAILASLPACTFRDEKGRVRVDRTRVAVFEQPFDLSKYGYDSLVPVFGCRLWPESSARTAVVQTRDLASLDNAHLRPRLLRASERVPEEAMWRAFEEPCPGLDRNLIQLLVAARAVAEGGESMPPMVFVTGVTGASKSLSVHLAASVCGDRNTEVVWSTNVDRMRQAVMDAATAGTYVTFNEVIKESRRQVKQQSQAMDYVLNLTPDSVSHYMYVGPVRMGRLPVFVWTDTDVPMELRQDAQLARRIVHVHLPSKVEWETSLRDSGVGHPRRFRVSCEARAKAADSLLSLVVERFVPGTFEEVARALGFGRMRDSAEAEEGVDALRALFDAVCAAPPAAGADASRWKGRGWKVLERDVASPLRDAWLAVADEDGWERSRRAAEEDWRRVLDLREPAKLETRAHGHRLALRFRGTGGSRVDYRVNEELRPGTKT